MVTASSIKEQAGEVVSQLDTAIKLLEKLQGDSQDKLAEEQALGQQMDTLGSARECVYSVYVQQENQTPNLAPVLTDFEELVESLVHTLGGNKPKLRVLTTLVSGVKDTTIALKMQLPGNYSEVNGNKLENGVGINGVVGQWNTTLRMHNRVEGNEARNGIQINGWLQGDAAAIERMLGALPTSPRQ
ncbi:hypothetical protein FLONG3_7652 [Fusarium longipes]|uniref:Uncharacterized protein n=1 Tax=Fusarium longipes TaxID=694270 RepID=A0A395SBV6_9HYPO|nr:hypothetical protein FLONG3_7652 [Fusarium longipes]